MTTHIGVRARGFPTFQELLYFDQLILVGAAAPLSDEESANLEFLEKHGIIGNELDLLRSPLSREKFRSALDRVQRAIDHMKASVPGVATTWDSANSLIAALDSDTTEEEVLAYLRVLWRDCRTSFEGFEASMKSLDHPELRSSASKFIATLENAIGFPWREAAGVQDSCVVTAVLSGHPAESRPQVPPNPVLEVTLNNLPIPSEDTPLEDVVAFRTDDRAREELHRLRRCVGRLARQGLSKTDANDEIEGRIADYTEYMRLHRIKHRAGTMQTLMSVSAAVLEELIHLRPRAALDSAMEFHARRLALTEAELHAPGREVAYIVRSRASFP